MSTHTIGLLVAILGGFVPLAKPLPWRIALTVLPAQTFTSTLQGQNLLAQTPAPSSLPEDRPTPELTPAVKQPRVSQGSQWRLCDRKQKTSQRSSGFTGDTTGTYISNIQVNLHSNTYTTVTLKWANENLSSETLPVQFNASPGAGNCNADCRWRSLSRGESTAQSQKRGSHCTPLSPPTYLVQGYGCVLPKYPEAKFVTWFDAEREIAFHAYAVPPYPASHGCMRLLTKNRGAEWIYDNTLAGITQVKIEGNPLAASLSPKCWSGDRLISRPTKKRTR